MYILEACIKTILIGIVYASYFEWTLHRYVMHRPLWFFMYPFIAHHKTHHKIYEADETYHFIPGRIAELAAKFDWIVKPGDTKITMAVWNGIVLSLFGPIPFYVFAYTYYGVSWIALAISLTSMLTSAGYYCIYEYLHHCMHLPKKTRLEKSKIFILLNGHHILHHRYKGRNFNVVLPLADITLGTLLLRSKIPFRQVRGPSVPDNLQPQMA